MHRTVGLYDKVKPRAASTPTIILIHFVIHFCPIYQIHCWIMGGNWSVDCLWDSVPAFWRLDIANHNFTNLPQFQLFNLNIDIKNAFVQDWMFEWKRDWHCFRQDYSISTVNFSAAALSCQDRSPFSCSVADTNEIQLELLWNVAYHQSRLWNIKGWFI